MKTAEYRAQLAVSVNEAWLTERVRARVAESSCGLCGIENLEAVARPLPPVAALKRARAPVRTRRRLRASFPSASL